MQDVRFGSNGLVDRDPLGSANLDLDRERGKGPKRFADASS